MDEEPLICTSFPQCRRRIAIFLGACALDKPDATDEVRESHFEDFLDSLVKDPPQ